MSYGSAGSEWKTIYVKAELNPWEKNASIEENGGGLTKRSVLR